jgi:anti-sigma-K factor RskA
VTGAHDDRELLGGYLLGALDPEERERVRAHLAVCEQCAAEHDSLVQATAMLDLVGPDDVPLASPSPRLEEALLDRHARERRLGKTAARARPRRRPALVAATLAATAVVTVLIAVLVGRGQGTGADGAEGAVRLAPSAAAPRATGRAELREVSAGTGVRLSLRGLAPRSRAVYTLWCVRDDGRWVSAGSFRVDGRGSAHASLTAAVRQGEYGRVLVTRSHPGSDARRGPTVLAGSVEYE